MSRQAWLAEEVGVFGTAAQCAALWRAGFSRLWLTLSLSLAVSSLVVGCLMLMGRTYAPTFVIRVVEAEHHTRAMPPLKRQLGEYVRQAVFTSQPLLEIMKRHGLYPSLLRKNQRAALESFKEDISVEVYQNYFVEQRAPGDSPRSARLLVSFRSKNAEQALAVTRELGALIVAHERNTRRDQALAAVARAEHARDVLVSAYQERSADVVAKQSEMSRAQGGDPELQVQVVGLLGSLGRLERDVEAAERRASALDLGATLERHGMGLSFQIVDDGSLPGRAGRLQAQALAGAATFVFGLPLIALGVGAFLPKRGEV